MKQLIFILTLLCLNQLQAAQNYTINTSGSSKETRKCASDERTLSLLKRSAYLNAVNICTDGEVSLISDWSVIEEECTQQPVYPGAARSWDVLESTIEASFLCTKF